MRKDDEISAASGWSTPFALSPEFPIATRSLRKTIQAHYLAKEDCHVQVSVWILASSFVVVCVTLFNVERMAYLELGQNRLTQPHPLRAFELALRPVERPLEARFVAEQPIQIRVTRHH